MKAQFSLSQVNPSMQLFGNDTREGIHWGKLFFHLFKSYYSTQVIYDNFKLDVLYEGLVDAYQILGQNIIKNLVSKSCALLEGENECSEYFLVLKHGLCVYITEPMVNIMYCSEISQPEIESLILFASERTFKVGNSKEILKVKNSVPYFGIQAK